MQQEVKEILYTALMCKKSSAQASECYKVETTSEIMK